MPDFFSSQEKNPTIPLMRRHRPVRIVLLIIVTPHVCTLQRVMKKIVHTQIKPMNSPQNRVSLNLCADPQLVREVLNWALRYLIQTPHAAKYRDFQKESRKKRNFT